MKDNFSLIFKKILFSPILLGLITLLISRRLLLAIFHWFSKKYFFTHIVGSHYTPYFEEIMKDSFSLIFKKILFSPILLGVITLPIWSRLRWINLHKFSKKNFWTIMIGFIAPMIQRRLQKIDLLCIFEIFNFTDDAIKDKVLLGFITLLIWGNCDGSSLIDFQKNQ